MGLCNSGSYFHIERISTVSLPQQSTPPTPGAERGWSLQEKKHLSKNNLFALNHIVQLGQCDTLSEDNTTLLQGWSSSASSVSSFRRPRLQNHATLHWHATNLSNRKFFINQKLRIQILTYGNKFFINTNFMSLPKYGWGNPTACMHNYWM